MGKSVRQIDDASLCFLVCMKYEASFMWNFKKYILRGKIVKAWQLVPNYKADVMRGSMAYNICV